MSAPVGMGRGVQPSVPPEAPGETILGLSPDGMALFTGTGELIHANAAFNAFPEVLRARVAELIKASALRPPERRGGPLPVTTSEVELPGGATFEVRILPQGSGTQARSAAVVRDVTDARTLTRWVSQVDRAGAELLRYDAQQIRDMNAVERLQLLESRLVKAARDVLHFESFSVWLLDEKSGRLECIIRHGLPAEVANLELYRGQEGNGITGHVAATGTSYLCDDAESDPLFMPGATGAKCSLTVPLKVHERVIGILDAESTRAHAFSSTDRTLAEVFGRYVAMALGMLELLVVERAATNSTACGRVEGEIREPLEDILTEVEWLLTREEAVKGEGCGHVQRIRADVESIRQKLRDAASGPQTILGVDRAMAKRETDPVLSGKRVLVADDESRIRRVLGDVLRHRGCDVTICACGEEAIEAIEHTDRFDLVVSDIKMPDRNGYEVFAAARAKMGEVPVILMTGFGYDPHHSIVRASQEGLQAVLFKPFQIERMVDEVRKALTPKA